jgi:hypothetical protein
MPPTFRKNNDDTKNITFTVRYQDAFDLAIVAAYFAELGLKTTELVQAFEQQNKGFLSNNIAYETLAEASLAELHSNGAWYGFALKTAKKAGFASITFQIPVGLYNEIAAFLVSPTALAIIERANDASYQEYSGAKDAFIGAGKNLKESIGDIGSGGGNLASGTFDTLTSAVGSKRFSDGFDRAKLGAAQSIHGYFKGSLQTPTDFFVMLLGKAASGFQTRLYLESVGRPVDPAEKQVLQQVFGGSIEYDAIRIKTGYAGVLSAGDDGGLTLFNNNRAITFGNTIYMKNNPYNITPGSDWLSTLVHETTHVWQHQNGGTDYMGEALYAQAFDGYGYEPVILANPPRTWFLLNPEQQGQLIQDAYTFGFLQHGVPNGKWMQPQRSGGVLHRPDYEQYFINQNVLGQLRNGQGST